MDNDDNLRDLCFATAKKLAYEFYDKWEKLIAETILDVKQKENSNIHHVMFFTTCVDLFAVLIASHCKSYPPKNSAFDCYKELCNYVYEQVKAQHIHLQNAGEAPSVPH